MNRSIDALNSGVRLACPEPELGARLYTAMHRGNDGDVAFYLRRCGRGERVLEFGVGAGRVAIALAESGADVTGIDSDPQLVKFGKERLREREMLLGRRLPLTFLHGDMARFSSEQRFDRVFIPYSGLWCLPGIEQKRACLQAAYRCLNDTGMLCFDVYDTNIYDTDAYDADGEVDEANIGRGGHGASDQPGASLTTAEESSSRFAYTHDIQMAQRQLSVFERNTWWPERREICVEYRIVPLVGAERRHDEAACGGWLMSLNHHYLLRHELAGLLDDCGFETEWGADELAESTAFGQQMIVSAVKS